VSYDALPASLQPADYGTRAQPSGRVWPSVENSLQVVGSAFLAVALYAAVSGQLDFGKPAKSPAVENPEQVATPAKTAAQTDGASDAKALPPPSHYASAQSPFPVPLPTTYGVYAAHNGQLTELEPLPVRVPDLRVTISLPITKPSSVTLPDGKVAFVIFRRDLLMNAPDKVPVRVVAQVKRELTFKAGKAITTPIEGDWRIRGNTFDFKVSPVVHNREMIIVQSDAELTLPPGRYALNLYGIGYDFAVAGPITSPMQCLERAETVERMAYSECRTP
jgi:hypothetical protein